MPRGLLRPIAVRLRVRPGRGRSPHTRPHGRVKERAGVGVLGVEREDVLRQFVHARPVTRGQRCFGFVEEPVDLGAGRARLARTLNFALNLCANDW